MSFIIASLVFWKGKNKSKNTNQKSVELPTSGKMLKSAASAWVGGKEEKMKSILQKYFTTKLTCLVAVLLEYKVVQHAGDIIRSLGARLLRTIT